MRLYVVTLQEQNNQRCERDVYVQAASLAKGVQIAVQISPENLHRPKAVAVRLLGEVY